MIDSFMAVPLSEDGSGMAFSPEDAINDPQNQTYFGTLLSCGVYTSSRHLMFQLANGVFFISYLAPSQMKGLLFMHSLLILGYLLYATWAWNIICSPLVFTWAFCFMLLNMGQALHIAYQLRPVKINRELESVYQEVFAKLHVPRLLYKRLISMEYAQVMSLHAGEAYAMQNLTRTDRLGLLISGKVNVMSESQFLHSIAPMQFLDSPEFESSRATLEDKFKVSIIAATSCRYVFWQRTGLEYLFVKEPFLANIMSTLIARDITTKLYSMNTKIVTEKGSHLDIRLPSLTSSLSSCGGSLKSPAKTSLRSSGDSPATYASASSSGAIANTLGIGNGAKNNKKNSYLNIPAKSPKNAPVTNPISPKGHDNLGFRVSLSPKVTSTRSPEDELEDVEEYEEVETSFQENFRKFSEGKGRGSTSTT